MNRSSFFYVGDKYKLMNQILKHFPTNIKRYFEPFVGGGSSFLNVKANKYFLNDINFHLIELHKLFISHANSKNLLFKSFENIIKKYNFSSSYLFDIIPSQLKKEYPKTYYAKFNKEVYVKLKIEYNQNKDNYLYLYLLLIYGFNRILRFNSQGNFNVPVGNLDFNNNVVSAINDYLDFSFNNELLFYNLDYLEFLNKWTYTEGDFIYLDPPYLISNSEYNKLWNESNLLNFLDELNNKGIKFAISNLLIHKEKNNIIFEEWSKKYRVVEISSNYISYHDNSQKIKSKEVLVMNYE